MRKNLRTASEVDIHEIKTPSTITDAKRIKYKLTFFNSTKVGKFCSAEYITPINKRVAINPLIIPFKIPLATNGRRIKPPVAPTSCMVFIKKRLE